MANKVYKQIGHNQADSEAYVGEERSISVDTTKETVRVHDGVTPGGTALAREDLANVPTADAQQRGAMTPVHVGLLDTLTGASAGQGDAIVALDARLTANEAADAEQDVALGERQLLSEKDQPEGYAGVDVDGKVLHALEADYAGLTEAMLATLAQLSVPGEFTAPHGVADAAGFAFSGAVTRGSSEGFHVFVNAAYALNGSLVYKTTGGAIEFVFSQQLTGGGDTAGQILVRSYAVGQQDQVMPVVYSEQVLSFHAGKLMLGTLDLSSNAWLAHRSTPGLSPPVASIVVPGNAVGGVFNAPTPIGVIQVNKVETSNGSRPGFAWISDTVVDVSAVNTIDVLVDFLIVPIVVGGTLVAENMFVVVGGTYPQQGDNVLNALDLAFASNRFNEHPRTRFQSGVPLRGIDVSQLTEFSIHAFDGVSTVAGVDKHIQVNQIRITAID